MRSLQALSGTASSASSSLASVVTSGGLAASASHPQRCVPRSAVRACSTPPRLELGDCALVALRRCSSTSRLTSSRSVATSCCSRRAHGVGLVEELASVTNGRDRRCQPMLRSGSPSACRSRRCRSCHSASRFSSPLVSSQPALEVLAEAVVVVGHGTEPLVAAEARQGRQCDRCWGLRAGVEGHQPEPARSLRR